MSRKYGFNFIPLPFDVITAPYPSLGELLLLCYLFRHCVRLGESVGSLTDDEIINGVWARNGKRSDTGCGISRNTMKEARESLLERRWITATDRGPTPQQGHIYTVNLSSFGDNRVSEIDTEPVSKIDAPVSKIDANESENDTPNTKGSNSLNSMNIKPKYEPKPKYKFKDVELPPQEVERLAGMRDSEITMEFSLDAKQWSQIRFHRANKT